MGRDVTVEYYLADGQPERMSALAADRARRRLAEIVASTGFAALAAKAETRDIPIIFGVGSDPVESGLVTGLNRPGGNVTSIAVLGADIAEKRLELLRKAMPGVETIALLAGPGDVRLDRGRPRRCNRRQALLGCACWSSTY
jgi:putative tryptophan/tyrosine transport system substrate-binding protein